MLLEFLKLSEENEASRKFSNEEEESKGSGMEDPAPEKQKKQPQSPPKVFKESFELKEAQEKHKKEENESPKPSEPGNKVGSKEENGGTMDRKAEKSGEAKEVKEAKTPGETRKQKKEEKKVEKISDLKNLINEELYNKYFPNFKRSEEKVNQKVILRYNVRSDFSLFLTNLVCLFKLEFFYSAGLLLEN